MKKSILIINSYMHIGGVEKALLSLLYTLSEYGYDITLMLVSYEGKFISFIPDNIKIKQCPFKKEILECNEKSISQISKMYFRKRKYLSWLSFGFSCLVMKYVKYDRLFAKNISNGTTDYYDVIFNFAGPGNFNSVLSEEIFSCNKKFIWVHNEIKKSEKSVTKYKYRYTKYDYVFTVSKACRDEFVEQFPKLKDKTKILYNITDTNLYYKMANGNKSFNDKFDGMRILSVGRLSKQKGFDIAINVAMNLQKNNIDFKWYIIGDGEERDVLRNQVEKNNIENYIEFLGAKTNPYPFFRDCDIYVQPSRYEGFGLTINEAKAFNKPIVSTKFAGAYEQIENEKTGFIVECNIEELTYAIMRLINDERIREYFSENLKLEEKNTYCELEKLIKFIEE